LEDEFKSHWLSLPEEEIKVCIVALFMFSHRFVSTSAVETSGCRAGTSSHCTTSRNKLTDIAPPPPEEGSQRTKEEKGYVFVLFQSSASTDPLLAA
jgi:hypothetical protein